MAAPPRRSARLLKAESSVPIARNHDVKMVHGGGGPVEQQRSQTRSSASGSSVSQHLTRTNSPKPELGESTDDDDEEPVNHHIRPNRSERREVHQTSSPEPQPMNFPEQDNRSSVPSPSTLQHLTEPSFRKTVLEDSTDDEEKGPVNHKDRSKRSRRRQSRRKKSTIHQRTKSTEKDVHAEDILPHSLAHGIASDEQQDEMVDTVQGPEQGTPKKATAAVIDTMDRPTFALKEEYSISDLEATLRTLRWKQSPNDATVYVSRPAASIRLLGRQFTLSCKDEKVYDKFYHALSKFIEKEDIMDEFRIAVTIAQSPKPIFRPKSKRSAKTPYHSMIHADLVQECKDRQVNNKPAELDSPREFAIRLDLIARLMAHDEACQKLYEQHGSEAHHDCDDTCTHEPGKHDSENSDGGLFKCTGDCRKMKPLSAFMRIGKKDKKYLQRSDCHECNEKLGKRKLRKKEGTLSDRLQFMQDNYPGELTSSSITVNDLSKCSKCPKFFIRGFDRDEHLKECSKGKKRCKYCGKSFSIEEWKANHHSKVRCEEVRAKKKSQREELKHKCQYCLQQIPVANDRFSHHVSVCVEEHIYCPSCEKWVQNELIDDHGCKPRVRRWCGNCKRLVEEASAAQHRLEGCEERFGCWECRTYWDSTQELDEHICSRDRSCWKCGKGGFGKGELAPHVETCLYRRCHRCQKNGFSTEDFQVHFDTCPKRWCHSCGVSFVTQEAKDAHDCCYRLCSRCQTFKIPADDFQEHWDNCEWRVCRRCGLRLPKSQYQSHFDACTFKTHLGCGARLPEDEMEEHKNNCSYRNCYKCGANKIHDSLIKSHLNDCEYEVCSGCQERNLISANHDCGQSKCYSCLTPMPTEEFNIHKSSCRVRLHIERLELEEKGQCGWLPHLKSKRCTNPKDKGVSTCSEHASLWPKEYVNSAIEKSQFQRRLFTNNALLDMMSKSHGIECAPAITKYMGLFENSSKRVLASDTEGNVGESIKTSYQTFQLTIKNGNGDIVVPQCVIDHEDVTKEQLFKLSGAYKSVIVRGTFRKYYGEPNEERATGRDDVLSLTWSQIAGYLETYVKDHVLPKKKPFLAFVDWSQNHIDFFAIKAGLASVKKSSLLPADPKKVNGKFKTAENFNPLIWWRVFRGALGLATTDATMWLGLSNFFSILFPDERRLAACAHDSEPDVDMLLKILRFTFCIWKGGPIPGRLDKYLVDSRVPKPTVTAKDLKKIEEEELQAVLKEGDTEREEDGAAGPEECADADDSNVLVEE